MKSHARDFWVTIVNCIQCPQKWVLGRWRTSSPHTLSFLVHLFKIMFFGQNRILHRMFPKMSFRTEAQFLTPYLVVISTGVEKSWFLLHFSCFSVVKHLRISNCDFGDFSTNFEFWFQSPVPGERTSCAFYVTIVWTPIVSTRSMGYVHSNGTEIWNF